MAHSHVRIIISIATGPHLHTQAHTGRILSVHTEIARSIAQSQETSTHSMNYVEIIFVPLTCYILGSLYFYKQHSEQQTLFFIFNRQNKTDLNNVNEVSVRPQSDWPAILGGCIHLSNPDRTLQVHSHDHTGKNSTHLSYVTTWLHQYIFQSAVQIKL